MTSTFEFILRTYCGLGESRRRIRYARLPSRRNGGRHAYYRRTLSEVYHRLYVMRMTESVQFPLHYAGLEAPISASFPLSVAFLYPLALKPSDPFQQTALPENTRECTRSSTLSYVVTPSYGSRTDLGSIGPSVQSSGQGSRSRSAPALAFSGHPRAGSQSVGQTFGRRSQTGKL